MNAAWLVRRLRCMSAAEVLHRALRALAPPPRYRQRPVQDGISAFAHRGAPALEATERAALIGEAQAILGGRVPLFAAHHVAVRTPPDWNAPLDPDDIKPLWELNRHLHLVRLAQAWALTGEPHWREAVQLQLRSWIEQCPPGKGQNWRSPLELAIRLINWSIVWQLLAGEVDAALRSAWLDSIYAHCITIARRLSRHSSANNHLIGELSGLYVAACTWPCWKQSPAWRAQASCELEREARAQFTSDGVHREQAFAYQVFVAELLTIAGLVGQATHAPFSAAYWQILRRAAGFVRAAGAVGNAIGDADDGRVWQLGAGCWAPAAQLLALDGALHDGADPADPGARWLLHLFPGPRPCTAMPAPVSDWSFPEGGYYLFGKAEAIHGMVDCGPLGYLGIAAHGHADALSLNVNVAGEPFLVDAGTYAYWCERRWRDYFRGTSAHNTLRIDGVDQSVGGGPFLWLRKAAARVEREPASPHDFDLVASHDGYLRLRDPVRHRRRVFFDARTATVTVRDTVRGQVPHLAEIFWHFAPHLDVRLTRAGAAVTGQRFRATFTIAGASSWTLARGADHPPLGWHSPHYPVKEPCTVLRIVNESSDVRVECQITIAFF